MVGIVSYGAYIPMYRLSCDIIGKAWGAAGGRGEKAVANWDEDSLTMGVEACLDCLTGFDRASVDGLYFASNTPIYVEKQTASILAAAADLTNELFAADMTASVKAGTSAMRAAADAVSAGSAKKVMVVASDMRPAEPMSEFESLFGDGAAAFLIGDADVAVSIEGRYSTSSEFMDIWRLAGEKYHRTAQARFAELQGYVAHVPVAVSRLFKKYSLTPKDFTKLVLSAPNARRHAEVAKKLGFAPAQVQDPLFSTVGHTGAASAPMMLVAALEEAKPGDKILLVNWGDGVDAFVLVVTEQIEKIRDRRGIKCHLASKRMLPNYGQYIRYRNLMGTGGPEGDTTPHRLWRERNQILRFHGHKCRQCGQIQYPMQHVCNYCFAKGDFEEIRLSDKKGPIFTFTMEERAPVPDLPMVVIIVDFEGGGRFLTRLTDRDPKTIDIGMPIELTFRYMHDAAGIRNYFWLARPVRC